MAYQGEYFIERYGAAAAEATPPVAKMLARGVKVSAGTDATRVASYNPWVSLSWMVTGKTVGGTRLYPARNCPDRETALRMGPRTWPVLQRGRQARPHRAGPAGRFHRAGQGLFQLRRGRDLVPDLDLTVVGGRVVYGAGEFGPLDDNPLPPAMPDWSPTRLFGGYAAWGDPDGAGRNSLGYRNMAARLRAPAGVATSMRAWARRRPARTCRASSARWAAPAGPCEGRRHEYTFCMGTAARRRGASAVRFGRDPFPAYLGCAPPICRAAW